MAEGRIKNTELSAIAAAIRQKNGLSTTYKPGEMAAAIQALPGAPTLQSLSVNANGSYTPGTGVDGYSSVSVDVPNSYAAGDEGKIVHNGALVALNLQSKNATENGTVTPDSGYDGLSSVVVNVSGGGGGLPTAFNTLISREQMWKIYVENSGVQSYNFDSTNRQINFTYHGGSQIGVRMGTRIPLLPGDASTLRYKITTGTSSYDTSKRFAVGLGILPYSYYSSAILGNTEYNAQMNVNAFLKYSYTQSREDVLQGSFDLTDITEPFLIYPFLAGWTATFELELA